VHLNFARQLL